MGFRGLFISAAAKTPENQEPEPAQFGGFWLGLWHYPGRPETHTVHGRMLSRSLLKKVLEGSRCAMLIQNSSGRRTKDSHRRHFVFGYCASSTRLRVFQQTARGNQGYYEIEPYHSDWVLYVFPGLKQRFFGSLDDAKRAAQVADAVFIVTAAGVVFTERQHEQIQ